MQVVQESIAPGLPGCHLPIYSPTSCFGEKWRYVRSILQKAPVGLTALLLLDAFVCLQVMELMVFLWARSSTHPLSCLGSSTQQLCPEQAVEVRGCVQLPLRLSPSLGTLHQCQLRCIRGDLALWLIQIARWVGHVAHPFLSKQQV